MPEGKDSRWRRKRDAGSGPAQGVQKPDPERLVEAYSDLILRVCYTCLRSTSDAEDICQDTLIKLIARDEPFNDPEHEKAWVIRVATNACRDLLRKRSAHAEVPLNGDEAEGLGADGGDHRSGDPGDVLSAVMDLPASCREAIYLYYYEGYSIRETAGLLGISESAASQRLSRGRARLKEALEGGENDG